VALTGRVYVQADTSNAPSSRAICDYLQFSGPGHESDRPPPCPRRDSGQSDVEFKRRNGMVLVLVTLQ